MIDFLHSAVQKTGFFSPEDLTLISSKTHFREITYQSYLLEKGQVCASIYLLVSGSAYEYKHDENGNEVVSNLFAPNDWIFNHMSFTTRKPSDFFIKTNTQSTAYQIGLEALHELIALSPSFFQLGRILGLSNEEKAAIQQLKTPDKKYLYLLNNRPELSQLFPQKMIASYLEMTPETLSRVRKRIKI